ncbi:MAG: hypothetical protein AB1513_05160 [Pseudomonadota bacterium]
MGVEIKLTDKQFPVSPVFIDFLHRRIEDKAFEATWHDQLSEKLVSNQGEIREVAQAAAGTVLDSPLGQQAVYRSYELLTAMLTGAPDKLRFFHDRYRFVCVVGCPRHGGSYLTKQLFLALGMVPDEVPNVLAHDGFPEAAPFEFKEGVNTQTLMTQNMAEYLAMVEVFFADSRLHNNYVTVPKKATKAAYQGAFFNAMLGPHAEYIVTLRHPVAACISTYEKSGGLPDDGKFKVRGNIEEWASRDNVLAGVAPETVLASDYFDVYLRYWENYHYQLALSGLSRNRNWTMVVYGKERMMELAQSFFARFRSKGQAEEFQVFDKRDRHPEWRPRAEAAMRRVAGVWRSVGLGFPIDAMMEGW